MPAGLNCPGSISPEEDCALCWRCLEDIAHCIGLDLSLVGCLFLRVRELPVTASVRGECVGDTILGGASVKPISRVLVGGRRLFSES